jgi:threonine/homoserine/homoserine lactone efflux protein
MPFDISTLLAFLAAAAVLVLIPGPGTAWVVGQSMAGGARRGIVAGLGLETATQLHALAASLGLSALLAASATAYEALRYAGAAYLIWFGIRTWRLGAQTESSGPDTRAGSMRRVYLRSVVTGVLNPKVALFFLAFLPQFVHPERGLVWLQFLVLGALLSAIGFAHSCALALASGRISGVARSARAAAWRQRAAGALFVGLGVRLALQSRQ